MHTTPLSLVLRLMQAARQSSTKTMAVWAGDVKIVEDAVRELEDLRATVDTLNRDLNEATARAAAAENELKTRTMLLLRLVPKFDGGMKNGDPLPHA